MIRNLLLEKKKGCASLGTLGTPTKGATDDPQRERPGRWLIDHLQDQELQYLDRLENPCRRFDY